jgi:two-component system, OmpR family, manganese sensing sensor histidine kinase
MTIVSPKPSTQLIFNDRQYFRLRWRLLVCYLSVMLATFSISGLAVYGLFLKSLYHEMDDRLGGLADGAAHNLADVKKQAVTEFLLGSKGFPAGIRVNPTRIVTKAESLPIIPIDRDGDLDISWQNMKSPRQGIEWFDEHYQLLTASGREFDFVPFRPDVPSTHNSQLHSLSRTVYKNLNGQKILQGYVRVNELAVVLDEELHQLQWVLGLGGLVGFVLTGLGGVWLTKQSLQPIQQNLHQLQQFTVDAAHELRSPLTAVKISVDILRSDSAEIRPADRHRIEVISKGIEQIRYLVEDLLLLTRMDVQLITHEWQLIAVDEVLEDLLELLEAQAQERQITIESNLLSSANVKGDNTQLPRLFRNLLDNALKYTPSGGTITVTMHRSKGTINIMIVDTGIGIAAAHLPLVFDRFWRADIDRTEERHSLGLGLAIAQSIARSHRGEITVNSLLNRGSCFQVKLPLA